MDPRLGSPNRPGLERKHPDYAPSRADPACLIHSSGLTLARPHLPQLILNPRVPPRHPVLSTSHGLILLAKRTVSRGADTEGPTLTPAPRDVPSPLSLDPAHNPGPALAPPPAQ